MVFRKGEYVLSQGDGRPNFNYCVYHDDGSEVPQVCMTMPCFHKLTPDEADKAIDLFKQLEKAE